MSVANEIGSKFTASGADEKKKAEKCLNKITADRKTDLFRIVLRHWCDLTYP